MSNFDAALPPPYSTNWKQAERTSPEDSPRLTSYEAPGGEPIEFILKNFKFSGGQSMDTAEYPFGGLWSNEALNEKPQELHIEGFIRGAEYIQTRNALIEALRVKTDDSTPGYIDFPFWGRFPIVVVSYEIAENTDEKGQCSVTLVFKRAGVSITERASSISGVNTAGISIVGQINSPSSMSIIGAPIAGQANSFFGMNAVGISGALETAVEDLENAAINSFEQALAANTEASTANILSQGFAQIKSELSSSLGRIQAAKAKLNAISAQINGLLNQVAQIIRAPGQLARALFDAIASIAAGLAEIKNSPASYQPAAGSASKSSYQAAAAIVAGSAGIANNAASYLPPAGAASRSSSYPAPAANNEKSVLLQFLSASTFTLSSVPLTVRQEAAQKAIENLYRISAFIAAGTLLAQLDVSFQKTLGYWKLFQKLEAGIDKNDPAVYAALETLRIYVSRILSVKELSAEKGRYFNAPMPLLSLAQYIGCGEEKLRELNNMADSFVISGSVLYV